MGPPPRLPCPMSEFKTLEGRKALVRTRISGPSSEDAEATPAAKKGAAKPPMLTTGAARGAPSPNHPYYLNPSELRDAAGKERCRFFVKDGRCGRPRCHVRARRRGGPGQVAQRRAWGLGRR